MQQQQQQLGPMQIIYRQIEAFWRAAARINPDLLHAVLRGNSAEFLGGASTETRISSMSALAQHNLHTYNTRTYIRVRAVNDVCDAVVYK